MYNANTMNNTDRLVATDTVVTMDTMLTSDTVLIMQGSDTTVTADTLRTNHLHNCYHWRNPAGELRMQKLKFHLITQSLKVLSLKPGVGQYIAMHATLTARDFFLANFFPSGPFTCIFSKTSPEFFLCELWLMLVPV